MQLQLTKLPTPIRRTERSPRRPDDEPPRRQAACLGERPGEFKRHPAGPQRGATTWVAGRRSADLRYHGGWIAPRPLPIRPRRWLLMDDSPVQTALCVLGHPIAGNPAQFCVIRALESLQIDWFCLSFDVPAQRLPAAIVGIDVLNFAGALIAWPHQETVAGLLAQPPDHAAPPIAPAANTDLLPATAPAAPPSQADDRESTTTSTPPPAAATDAPATGRPATDARSTVDSPAVDSPAVAPSTEASSAGSAIDVPLGDPARQAAASATGRDDSPVALPAAGDGPIIGPCDVVVEPSAWCDGLARGADGRWQPCNFIGQALAELIQQHQASVSAELTVGVFLGDRAAFHQYLAAFVDYLPATVYYLGATSLRRWPAAGDRTGTAADDNEGEAIVPAAADGPPNADEPTGNDEWRRQPLLLLQPPSGPPPSGKKATIKHEALRSLTDHVLEQLPPESLLIRLPAPQDRCNADYAALETAAAIQQIGPFDLDVQRLVVAVQRWTGQRPDRETLAEAMEEYLGL